MNDNCVCKTLKKIDIIQKNIIDEFEETCTRNELGNRKIIFNTRPVSLYLNNGNIFEINIDDNPLSEKTSIFRVEKVENCCATLRALSIMPNDTNNTTILGSTNRFITVNTNCFCSVKCFDDIYLNNIILIQSYNLYKNGEIIDSEIFEKGVHIFETYDLDNEEINPTYVIKIRFIDKTGDYNLRLIGDVLVNNPNFVINSISINNGVITISFTVNTAVTANLILISPEQNEQIGVLTFTIANNENIVSNFAFIVTIVNVYP